MKFHIKTIYFSTIFILFVVGVIHATRKIERYSDVNNRSNNLNELIPKEKLAVYQGVSAREIPVKAIEFEDDESKPSVDGSPNGPRSMFMFAYNKVSPECCLGERSGGYSTNGGCVCITDKQKQYFSENSKTLENLDKCVFP